SGCSPKEKTEWIQKYRNQYGEVMFVGDGTNDLMAITSADLGVGVYNGTLTIRNHADILLFHPHLGVINELLSFGKRVRRTIRINFFWAIAYNVIGIGVALMGLLHPFFAILAMMLSSIFVTLHSASLSRQQSSLGDREAEVNAVSGSPLLGTGVRDL
ncbi:HAD-IC family P-type ATPase, partial [Balneolaceae bacterium ANBcel3]|nr:HAD-IC family P-type ATPase [Balneolaceae bacterium ANBcel3]